MSFIFRWSGAYAGFLQDGWFFDPHSRYLGWCENDGTVWRADGTFWGMLVEGNYILADQRRSPPVPRPPRVPPVPVSPPMPPAPLLPRIPKPGWIDPLESLGRLPSPSDLAGTWSDGETAVDFAEDGTFVFSAPATTEVRGQWALDGTTLTVRERANTDPVRYGIVEYLAGKITLRLLSGTERSLLFTLQKETDFRRDSGSVSPRP